MYILDLHGDSNVGESPPDGQANMNVFDIQQGVSIAICSRLSSSKSETIVSHKDSWGSRSDKYVFLSKMDLSGTEWARLCPYDPSFFLIPFNDANLDEYHSFPSLSELMPVHSCGIKTHRDSFMIGFNKSDLLTRFEDVASENDLDTLRQRYHVHDTPHWSFKEAQKKIAESDIASFVRPITYRPFDNRWIYYNPSIIEKGDSKYPTLRHMLHKNNALLASRIQAEGACNAVFVTTMLAEMKTAESTRSCTVFPLYLTDDDQETSQQVLGLANFNKSVLKQMLQNLGLTTSSDEDLPENISPEAILSYVYAILYSPGYRLRYTEFLKNEFPRLPFANNFRLFQALVDLGEKLIALHLFESPKLNDHILTWVGNRNYQVEQVSYSDVTVWFDKAKLSGLRGVPEEVWNFQIGGYKVCEKWLKARQAKGGKNSRPGCVLTEKDINHYQKIVVALSETIRIMAEIDEVIEGHGGWSGAFLSDRKDRI
jgi:predicted helicase